MDKMKQTLVFGLVAVLVVLGGGWKFLVSPQKAKVTSLNAQTATVNTANDALQTKISALKSQAVEGPAAQAALDAIARRLPPNLAEASLLKTLEDAAVNANVNLTSVTPGAPAAVSVAAATTVVVTTTPAAGTGTTAAAPAAPANPNQLFSLPVSMAVSGDYFNIEMFIHNLENMQRAVLVSGLSFTAPTSVAKTSTTTTGGSTSGGSTVATGTGTATTTGKASAGKASTAKGSKTTKVAAAKPVPGSAAAAAAAAAAEPQFIQDADTLTVSIQASVFSMYNATAIPVVTPTTATPTK